MRRRQVANQAGQSQVDRAAMAQAAQQVDEAVQKTRAMQAQLESYKSSMMTGWAGDAAAAFERVFAAFSTDLANVITAWQGLGDKLSGSQARYTASEQTKTERVSQVSGTNG
jgi:WXG100 family type VII secretion target